MEILLSPYSRKLLNGKVNPKNYLYFPFVISKIRAKYPEARFVHVGTSDREQFPGTAEHLVDLPMWELKKRLDSCFTWISVDNFFHHFAAYYGKMGIAIFTVSDPNIFGHPINYNLLKDRLYLRKRQYQLWEQCEEIPGSSIPEETVVDTFDKLVEFKRGKR